MNIDDIKLRVIKDMQRNLQVRPTVYVTFQGSSLIYMVSPLNFIGDSRAHATQLFHMGRDFGLRPDHTDRLLAEICWVTEVWLTEGQKNPTPGKRPPASVRSKEGVILYTIEGVFPFTSKGTIFEIRRENSTKKPMDLREIQGAEFSSGWLVPLAFMAGWYSRSLSEEEVRRMLQSQDLTAFLPTTEGSH